jgi:hypothetical protein
MSSAAERKTLLVVEPGVKLNGDAYKKLDEAGYIVVRGDPSQFHLMESIPSGHADAITDAALATMRVGFNLANGSDVRNRFAIELLNRLASRGAA